MSQAQQGQQGGNPADGQSGDFGNEDLANIVDPDFNLNGQARNWGQLSSKLQTELLESARRSSDGDYARLIRQYFRDISKTRPPEPELDFTDTPE